MDQHYRQRPGAMTNNSSAAGSPRPGTPQDSPFADPGIPPVRPLNPFSSPFASRSPSVASGYKSYPSRYFHSRRVRKGEVERPWLDKKDPKEKYVTIIPIIGIVIGLALAGFLVWDGLSTVVYHKYCSVLNEDFSQGLSDTIWTKEAEVGGFGNGQFEQTTTTDENVYVQNGKLYIKPTLQDATLVESNNIINLTADGSCSSTILSDCISITNIDNGTIVQPVKSGRINTKAGATIKYGRVEVSAKLPAGDWLWPAIWLLPVDNVYGPWPASGEIDVVESRGNNYTYAQGGNNIVSSALHWGPNSANDAWWRTNVKRQALHTTYASGFHTFGLEWSEKYLFTYVDTRLLEVMYVSFNEPLFKRGDFPTSNSNGTTLADPWSSTGRDQTPFDQEFYLILNVAVGGTNGWFEDGKSGKPWVDAAATAKNQFWAARDQWYPTWSDNGWMEVESVKMWQQCDGGELSS